MYIERNNDVITGEKDLEHLHTFKKFPVFMGCTSEDRSKDLTADMSFWISRGSGMMQLNPLLELDVLYPEAHGAGQIGGLWLNHHKAFAEFIYKFSPKSVLEIGGSHGILAKNYQTIACIPWTIVEPNPTPINGCQANFIKGFFDEKFTLTTEVDTVVHSHVFEHIYNPTQFMMHLSGFMGEEKQLLFSVPNMQVMLEKKYTNCLNFEHTVFLNPHYIEYLLSHHGFRVVARQRFLDDHSIFYACVKNASVQPISLDSSQYKANKNIYDEYIRYHNALIIELNSKLAEASGPVYLFGAHVFAQYLLAFGLKTEKILGLLDNDLNKQGKRLYGTELQVYSPEILKNIENPIVILKAGVYDNEIKSQIIDEININTVFI
jgi:hypothetical protein